MEPFNDVPFPGNDGLYHKHFRFLFPWNPVVETACCAPDEAIAGFRENFMFGLFPAVGT